jgi:hypothetical protein
MEVKNSNQVTDNSLRGLRQRTTIPLIIVAALFIIVPFLTWYGTWFGRDLSDDKVTEYLSDENNPRHVQHALAQVAERLEKKDANVRRWYPQIVALSNSSLAELRSNAAWVMGKDSQAPEFRVALQRLVGDVEPIVQRNAATALVAFGDNSGRSVLRAMLQPYSLTSPVDGQVDSVLKEGAPVKVGMMLARMKAADNHALEIRSPLPGDIERVVVSAGANLKAGDTMLFIAPDSNTVWEALRALYFVGDREDLPLVERYAQGVDKMPEQIKQQAALTAKAIQNRFDKSQ